ncbi:phosphoenolpyruvate--protein phosphotransferase [Paratissierella segnis]|jgi:phosphotransferase system enzyme I (PtsI)|uniref:Phosphoenolpyruvate-protein phosphotransferase n=1 Tax=Paratissierella segnis TaxID=2763679 RepID=A0A926IF85_9FIRM|nr:phosphoenolpyruvate--protein phosphotransferase [Paratissierella segnis]MBC8588222.1 phosphoenolpyruvate--protein phosphotransferase [Paratissierella segnis]
MKGIGTSSGIGIGKVFLFKEPELKIIKKDIENPGLEIQRFENALKDTKKEIDKLHELSLKNIGEKEAEIFIAHSMMLEDPEFIAGVKDKIENEKLNSEYAVNEVVNFYVSLFEDIEDEYLKARAVDLQDVSKRLLRVLMGIKSADLTIIDEKSIIVAEDLTPSDTAQMNKDMVVGIVTELGGRTSHTSIIARTLEIPAISGVKDATKTLKHGDYIIINGDNGEIIINPSSDEIKKYEEKAIELADFRKKLLTMKDRESISKDGHKVEIAGNIGTPKDIDKVIENGGEGVGLYRTEFLYMDRDRLPSEEEQFELYKIVAQKLGTRPLVIRTLDVGGDKELPYLSLPKEMNPFLGYRAIRLCLDRQDIFRTQLRAILRASSFGNIKIMFPMISNIKEIRDAKAIIEEVKEELRKENIPFDEDIEIGIMVEIPAAAIHSRIFAKEVDFFSIGTNDLIQYTLAVDRGNQDIAYLYNQYHPAVLNLIRMTIENGHKEGIWVGMCGEAAGDKKLLPVLLAMGLDEFSMSASSMLRARYDLQNYSKEEVQKHLDTLLSLPTAEDVEKYIDENIIK